MSDRRLRVLVVASHPVQYASPIFRLMAQHPRLDFEVAYCSLRGAEPGHDPEFGRSIQWDIPLLDGYKWTHIPNRGSGDESFLGLYNPGLWRFIRDGRFDAVICHTGYPRASFWISYFAAKLSRSAFLFGTDATTFRARDGRNWKQYAKAFLWPVLFRLADQVVVPSGGTRDLMISLGIRADRITLTPYVVDNDWWLAQSAQVDRAAVRASWRASSEHTVILFCAKLQPWKRPLDLLHAFAKSGLPRGLLVFAGDGPQRPQLESAGEALGISDHLRLLGFVNQSQLPAIYTSADVLVLPSEYEPFGVVVNEAMLCGCPVIASDRVGAGQDLIQPGRTGYVYKCGDFGELSRLLRRVSSESAQRLQIASDTRQHMLNWSPKQHVDATFEAVLRSIPSAGDQGLTRSVGSFRRT